jgi:hypothetical protein
VARTRPCGMRAMLARLPAAHRRLWARACDLGACSPEASVAGGHWW